MTNIWHDISPERITRKDFEAVIEISKGSKMKYELDKETGLLKLDRVLHTSTHYPANYGFIPRTYAEDNDPLDVLVLCSEKIEPRALVRCYPIGVISMIDGGHADDKIIAIPFGDPTYNGYKDISQLPKHIFDEMTHFFTVYKMLENKDTAINEQIVALNQTVNNKLDKKQGCALISDLLIEKLEKLDTTGEENYIKSVSDEFIVTDGKLSINKIEQDKIEGLADIIAAAGALNGVQVNGKDVQISNKKVNINFNDSEFEYDGDKISLKKVAVQSTFFKDGIWDTGKQGAPLFFFYSGIVSLDEIKKLYKVK